MALFHFSFFEVRCYSPAENRTNDSGKLLRECSTSVRGENMCCSHVSHFLNNTNEKETIQPPYGFPLLSSPHFFHFQWQALSKRQFNADNWWHESRKLDGKRASNRSDKRSEKAENDWIKNSGARNWHWSATSGDIKLNAHSDPTVSSTLNVSRCDLFTRTQQHDWTHFRD